MNNKELKDKIKGVIEEAEGYWKNKDYPYAYGLLLGALQSILFDIELQEKINE